MPFLLVGSCRGLLFLSLYVFVFTAANGLVSYRNQGPLMARKDKKIKAAATGERTPGRWEALSGPAPGRLGQNRPPLEGSAMFFL